jgi:uncharacterized damage-inducible protein DinB
LLIIGEKLNSTIPKVRKAIKEKDAAFVQDLAQKQAEQALNNFRHSPQKRITSTPLNNFTNHFIAVSLFYFPVVHPLHSLLNQP